MTNIVNILTKVNQTDLTETDLTATKTSTDLIATENPAELIADDINLLNDKIKQLTAAKKAAEQDLINLLGYEVDNTNSISTDKYKLTTNCTVKRSITDPERLAQLDPSLLRTKIELDTRKFKKHAVNDPALFSQLQDCIETKPNNPTLKIEKL